MLGDKKRGRRLLIHPFAIYSSTHHRCSSEYSYLCSSTLFHFVAPRPSTYPHISGSFLLGNEEGATNLDK